MTQVDDLSRSLIAFEQSSTLVIVVELSQSSWLVAGVVPGIERRPLNEKIYRSIWVSEFRRVQHQ